MPEKLLRIPHRDASDRSKFVVSERLRDLAYKRGPDTKLPTTRELCQLLGTTARTLNDALEHLELQNVIYRKPRNGIFVSQRLYQKNIALLMGACVFETPGRSPFWDVLWGYFIREAQKRNHALGETFSIHAVLRKESPTRPLDEQLARMIERGRIDGVLAVGLDADTGRWIKEFDLPIVAYAGSGIWTVVPDTAKIIRLGAEALADQGCRDIRLWLVGDNHPPEPDANGYTGSEYDIVEERGAFRDVLGKHGLAFDDRAILNNRSMGLCPYPHQEQGARAVEAMLADGGRPPDGLLINDDMMTVGAIKAMQDHGIRPGVDVKIASHANKGIPVLDTFSNVMTLIELDPEVIIRAMFERLDIGLAGQMPEDWIINVSPFRVRAPGRQ
jgi:DNA-binding LacI/PurR family transcriptional regulator